jgi:hypothetical protein
MPSLGKQNTILGLYVLNQTVSADALISNDRGIYYSRLFKKPNNHIWYQLKWFDNQTTNTFQKIDIDVRVRTGSDLPMNTTTGLRYTFEEFNALIKSETPDVVDGKLYTWQVSRSLLGSNNNSKVVNGNATPNDSVFELGTAFNTAKIPKSNDGVWNYWSLPRHSKTTYISNNLDHDYIQIRIDLRNLDPLAMQQVIPKMYKITLSSLLKQGS